MLTITVHTDGAAFADDYGAELARILHKLADDFDAGSLPAILHDVNGNRCGSVEVVHTRDASELVSWARRCAEDAGPHSVRHLSGTDVLRLCELAERAPE